jgi:hypothetical protein
MTVHEVVTDLKNVAAAGKDAVDSTVDMLDTFLDRLDQAFSSGDVNEAKQITKAVRAHKQEIAEAVATPGPGADSDKKG